MPYLGNTVGNRFVASQAATRLSGNGSNKVFTLEHSVASDEDILVSVDGVIQEPSIAYVVSNGTTLTFQGSDAPSNGTNNIFVCYLFRTVATIDHPATSALQATSGTFSSGITGTLQTSSQTNVTSLGTLVNLAISGDLTMTGDIVSNTLGTSNFRAGVNAGDSIASGGSYNVVIGDESGTALTTGDNNVAIGYEALKTEDEHGNNVGIGYQALKTLNAGASGDNVGVGYLAGTSMTTAVHNTLIGSEAGDALTDGSANVAIGKGAMSSDTRGQNGVAIGRDALLNQNFTSSTDSYNVAIGRSAGEQITTGIRNVLVGALSGDALTVGNYNVGIGLSALTADTQGTGSVAIGYKALSIQNFTSATTTNNTAVGYLSGFSTTTGTSNTYLGSESGYSTNTGIRNVAVGHQAMYSNTDGSNNTAIGWQALYTSTGQGNNVAIGWQSMQGSTSNESVAIGRETLESATGDDNVAIGYQTGLDMTSGYKNTLIGRDAGGDITVGVHNICIGAHAGNYAGQTTIQSGGQNILIGNYARPSATNQAYETIIGYNVQGQGSQTFTFGQGSTDTSIAFGGTSWSAPSDERLKEDIKDETVGLDFINELRPVTFQWKKANDIPESMEDYDKDSNDRIMNGKYNHGFIAQEVKTVMDKYEIKDGCNLWQESSGDKRQRIAEGELIPFLVKAIQELSAELKVLKGE